MNKCTSFIIIGLFVHCFSNNSTTSQETNAILLGNQMKGSGMPIQAAVIPAAGLGTRFLPFTKAIPKEMLPLVNKPTIQHIVEECQKANVNNLFIIIGNGKQAIIDYFDPKFAYVDFLKEKDKKVLQEIVNNIIAKINVQYITQPQPRGLGHAVLMAREVIDQNRYFAVLLPDDILVGNDPAIGTMSSIAQQEQATVIAVQEVPRETISSYGVISIEDQLSPEIYKVNQLVEKPPVEQAPSNLAIVGRYILPQKIFEILENTHEDAKGEIQLTDAIQKLMENGEKVLAYKIPHKRFDTGTPRGWLEAIIYFGLNDPQFATEIKEICELFKD